MEDTPTTSTPVQRPERGSDRLAALGPGRPRRRAPVARPRGAPRSARPDGARRAPRRPRAPRRSVAAARPPPSAAASASSSAGRRARRPRAARTRAARRPASRRPSGRRPAPRASRARTARRGSAGRRRPRPRASAGPASCGTGPTTTTPGRPRARARSGPSPTNASEPSPWRANASARRTTFLRSLERAEAEERRAVGLPAEPRRAPRRVVRARSAARSTPQSITSVFRAPRGRPPRAGRGASPRPRRPRRARRTASAWSRRGSARALGVRDVLAVGGQDGRAPAREHGEQARRDEEVRVDDVGPEPPRASGRRPGRARGDGTGLRGGRRPRARARARAAASPASRSATNVPSVGALGPGYICETSRIRIAPRPVSRGSPAGRRGTSRRSSPRPRGRSAARPCGATRRGGTSRARRLPARPGPGARAGTRPASGSSSAGSRAGAARAGVPGFSSTRIERPSRCMWPATAWIVIGAGRPSARTSSAAATGRAASLPQRRSRPVGTSAASFPKRSTWSKTAAVRSQSGACSPRRHASSTGAGRSTCGRASSRRVVAGRRGQHGARAVGPRAVQEVVVHLHHDPAARPGARCPVPARRRSPPQPGAHAAIQPASSRKPRGFAVPPPTPGPPKHVQPAPGVRRSSAAPRRPTPARCGRGSRGGRATPRPARSAPR